MRRGAISILGWTRMGGFLGGPLHKAEDANKEPGNPEPDNGTRKSGVLRVYFPALDDFLSRTFGSMSLIVPISLGVRAILRASGMRDGCTVAKVKASCGLNR